MFQTLANTFDTYNAKAVNFYKQLPHNKIDYMLQILRKLLMLFYCKLSANESGYIIYFKTNNIYTFFPYRQVKQRVSGALLSTDIYFKLCICDCSELFTGTTKFQQTM